MPSRREVLAIAGVGLAACGAGWLLANSRMGTVAQGTVTQDSGLASMGLTDLSGNARSMTEWKGRVLVVNFWATWCPPCREEIPDLVSSRDKLQATGAEFIGIALDQAAKVAEFVRSVRISYPILVADASALRIVRTLGNPSGGLPFTVVLDRQGEISHRNLGLVTRQKIESQVSATLAL